MVLIVGNKGSMGQRYSAIMRHLNKNFFGVDKDKSMSEIVHFARQADRIIVATPTDTHWRFLKNLLPLGRAILCEKPLATNMGDVDKILSTSSTYSGSFNMVCQYSELCDPALSGPSEYDFYNHGKDGLAWDCLQIIALAKEQIKLKETSPIWKCRVNGQRLNIGDMNVAYVNFIDKWLNEGISQKTEWLQQIHKKTEDVAREYRSKFN